MILLETNVISEFMREAPDPAVVLWLDNQPRASIWTTSINVYEIRSGLLSLPSGKRQTSLLLAFEHLLNETIQGRIAAFDLAPAQQAAELEAANQKKGRPREPRDTMIAGIVLASHAKLATRNVKHFEDIASSVVNPWGKS
jgi:predicted nucleic acid-binding protein